MLENSGCLLTESACKRDTEARLRLRELIVVLNVEYVHVYSQGSFRVVAGGYTTRRCGVGFVGDHHQQRSTPNTNKRSVFVSESQ